MYTKQELQAAFEIDPTTMDFEQFIVSITPEQPQGDEVYIKRVSYVTIKYAVSITENFNIQDFFVKSRRKELVICRQFCHWFARKYKVGSLSDIGWNLGRYDHATVLHSCKTINNYIFSEKDFMDRINQIDSIIKIRTDELNKKEVELNKVSEEKNNETNEKNN